MKTLKDYLLNESLDAKDQMELFTDSILSAIRRKGVNVLNAKFRDEDGKFIKYFDIRSRETRDICHCMLISDDTSKSQITHIDVRDNKGERCCLVKFEPPISNSRQAKYLADDILEMIDGEDPDDDTPLYNTLLNGFGMGTSNDGDVVYNDKFDERKYQKCFE